MRVALDTTEKRNALVSEITAFRDARLAGWFLYNGIAYPCDQTFQEAIKTYLVAYREGIIPANQTSKIRTEANTFQYLTQAELLLLAESLMAHVQGIWDEYWAAKDAI